MPSTKKPAAKPTRWPALLSKSEAAEYLGVSTRYFANLKALGKIQSVRFFEQSHPKYKRKDLDDLIDSMDYGSKPFPV